MTDREAIMEIGNALFGHSRGDYPVSKKLQAAFVDALARAGFDHYGNARTWKSETPAPAPYNDQATATHHFVIQPYVEDDRDSAIICPNFFDRVTGLKLRWYKYALRDAYANYDLGEEMLSPILSRLVEECQSLGATPYHGVS